MEDDALHEWENFGKQSVILRSDWYNIMHSLVLCYTLLVVIL